MHTATGAMAGASLARSGLASSSGRTEDLLVSVLLQLVIMIGAARAMNLLFRRFGQPGVIGETVAGLLLGPSLFGHLFPAASAALFRAGPAAPIVILSQIGLILLMFQIGADFDWGRLREGRAGRAVAPVALASVAVPFAAGVWLGVLSGPRLAGGAPVLVYALFCGVALAITAVPVLGRILTEYGLNRHELGVLALSAAALNDVAGWLLLAAVSAVATARFTPGGSAWQVGGVLAFAVLCWVALRPAIRWLLARHPVRDGEVPPTLLAVVLAFIFVMGVCTFRLGVFAIFGGFAAGLLFHHDRAFVEAWRRQVATFVLVFFLPIFFTFTGLRTNVLGLTSGSDWAWLTLFMGTAITSKIAPVYLAARAFRYDGPSAALLGVLMNTRGLMELIVLNVGLEMGVIPAKVFTMLVIVAIATTVMTGPMLRLLMPRLGLAPPLGVDV